MAISLKDQLLKAGLVDAKTARKAENAKKVADRQAAKGQRTEPTAAELAQQAQKAKAERDKAINQQMQAEKDRKALAAQIRQIIETHRVARNKGEQSYQFVDDRKVKKIVVDDAQHRQLVNGYLAIARLDQGYELIPAAIAERVRQRDGQAVVVLNTRATTATDDEDPYAKYVIPDDLMW